LSNEFNGKEIDKGRKERHSGAGDEPHAGQSRICRWVAMSETVQKPEEIIVAAVARNGVIGAQGSIPWHSPEELRLFRAITLGGTVIMGRRTYLSIGHPLAGRRNIIVSTTLRQEAGMTVVPSFAAAVTAALAALAPIYYCGGAQIYAQALERADAIYLSRMDAETKGDVFFPVIDLRIWEVVREERYADFVHLHYRRRHP